MFKNGAVVDETGKITILRPFPNRESPLPLGSGKYMIRLTDEQAATVKVGWVTTDNGATFAPE